GTASLYKSESYPYGTVKPGSVTATFAGQKDPTGYKGFDSSFNWTVQGRRRRPLRERRHPRHPHSSPRTDERHALGRTGLLQPWPGTDRKSVVVGNAGGTRE